MTENEHQAELEHFSEIEAVIDENLEKLCQMRSELKEQLLDVRREMWDDGRHLIRDFDDVIELTARDGEVSSAEKRFEQNEAEIRRQNRQKLSPYFGRLDYEDNGLSRTAYIGIYGLRREGSRRMLVVDWRAPVAAMFYSFDLGPGWFEPPGGRRDVNITLKRQFKIEDGRFRMMYDSDSAMFDEILGDVLSKNTDHSLRVIIGSIQKEQNAAIRGDTGRPCLIYGLAGSGKTSVGLHRLAYILYHDREKIKSENILIISNNSIFSSYISTILPDLGEAPAKSVVFHDMLSGAVGQEYDIEDYYEYLAAVEAGPGSPRAKRLKELYSPEFLDACVEYFADFRYKIPAVTYRDDIIISQEIFNQRWTRTRFSNFRAGYELVRQILRDTIEDYFLRNKEAIMQDIENSGSERLSDKEVALLYKRARHQYVADALDETARLNRLDPKLQAVDLMEKFSRASAEPFQAFQKKKLSYEDALLYMYIRTLMGETPIHPEIRHIVIDEAQDYNLMQLYIVRLLYPKANYTILADVFQAVDPVTAIQDYSLFDRAVGTELAKVRLEKCYRSSSEINALAFGLLRRGYPQLVQDYSYFERHTKKPRYVVSDDPLKAVGPILAQLEKYGSIAVITSDACRARQVKEYLGGSAHLMVSPDDELDGRIVILPLRLAKGLEFDAVVLVNMVNPGSADLRRRVYLGCTRALHELYLLEGQGLPDELEDCRPYLDVFDSQAK